MARYRFQTRNTIGLELDYGNIVSSTGGALTPSSTHARFASAALYVVSDQNAMNDVNNSLGWSGSGVTAGNKGSTAINIPNRGQQHLASLTPVSVPIRFGAESGVTVAATLSGLEYVGGSLSGSTVFAFPARPYNTPLAPQVSLSETGVITFTGQQLNAAADRFWDTGRSEVITDDGDWVTIIGDIDFSTGSGGSITVQPNRRYQARVFVRNDTGWGPVGYSQFVYGTPGTPILATERDGTSSVKNTWTINAPWVKEFTVERNTGSGWVTVATVGPAVREHTSTLSAGEAAEYRITAWSLVASGYYQQRSVSNTTSVEVSIPAPAPPTHVVNTLNSTTTTMTTRWQNKSTPAVPWDQVERQIAINGAWQPVTSHSGSATSATATVPVASRIQSRVRSVNEGGESDWVTSTFVYTRPPTPQITDVQRINNDEGISVTVAGYGNYVGRVRLEFSTNQTNWNVLASIYPHNNPTVELPGFGGGTTGWLRARVETPSPVVNGLWSPTVLVNPGIVTDKSGLPGVGTIFAGSEVVRMVYSGTQPIWVDGGHYG